jgi:hypothetical protein
MLCTCMEYSEYHFVDGVCTYYFWWRLNLDSSNGKEFDGHAHLWNPTKIVRTFSDSDHVANWFVDNRGAPLRVLYVCTRSKDVLNVLQKVDFNRCARGLPALLLTVFLATKQLKNVIADELFRRKSRQPASREMIKCRSILGRFRNIINNALRYTFFSRHTKIFSSTFLRIGRQTQFE